MVVFAKKTNRKLEVRGFLRQQTGESIVPSDDGRNDAKGTACNLGWDAAVVLGSGEQDKSDEQEKEQKDHADR